MEDDFIQQILETEQEKALWDKINQRLQEQIENIQKENIEKLADNPVASGAKYLDDPIHPKHVTTAPREIVIHIEGEISTTNEKQQLVDVSRLFNHYYHIAVPANTDFTTHLGEFIRSFDESVKTYAPRISPQS